VTDYVLVRSVYIWRRYKDSSGRDTFQIEIVQEWRSTSDCEAVEQEIYRINALAASRKPKSDTAGERLLDATSDYFADEVIKKTLGPPLEPQRWAATLPGSYSPAEMADAIMAFNDKLNELVDADMNLLIGDPGGIAGTAVHMTSGITAGLVLQPISGPLQDDVKILELIGLVVGLLTAQPALTMFCAKNLARQQLAKLISQTIHETLSMLTTNEAKTQPDSPAIALSQLLEQRLQPKFSGEPKEGLAARRNPPAKGPAKNPTGPAASAT
jgi:hypothetical protein